MVLPRFARGDSLTSIAQLLGDWDGSVLNEIKRMLT